MFLSISTSYSPATDLGYLLHKNPSRLHRAEMSFGSAYVYYPEASEESCTAVLALEVDPIGAVRGKNEEARWDQYVNDRPYAASSYISSALTELFGTAMSGRCKDRPELADQSIPLRLRLPSLRVRQGESLIRELFEPLGYTVRATEVPSGLPETDWRPVPVFDLELEIKARLSDVLSHLYILIPVLDDDKHYWVRREEIDKLLRRGGSWLPGHPSKLTIVRRYLQHQRNLTNQAMERLSDVEGTHDSELDTVQRQVEETVERKISLHTIRLETVAQEIRDLKARSVVDLGCGEGRLIRHLMKNGAIERIVGVDVSVASLTKAARLNRMDELSDRQRDRIELIHGALTYRDPRLEGFDVAALVEVIEHLDEARLRAMERVVFEFAGPRAVIVTTPNQEYNALFPTLPAGNMRHSDHRFEWTRSQFADWSQRVADQYGYSVVLKPLGPVDESLGAPSQMAIFRR